MQGNPQLSIRELPDALARGEIDRVLVVFSDRGWMFHPVRAGCFSEYPLLAPSGRPFVRRSLDGAWAFLRRCGLQDMEVRRHQPEEMGEAERPAP